MLPLEEKIKQLQKEVEQLEPWKYIKTTLIPGVIFAIIAFFYVGSWYDDNYGFDGSTGAAFAAAIGVLIAFAILGGIWFSCVRNSKLKEIDRLKQPVSKSHGNNSLADKFSRNHITIKAIEVLSNRLSDSIQRINRPKHIEEISVSVELKVYVDKLEYAYNTVTFDIERLVDLNSPEERKALAQAIAEGVREKVKHNYQLDIGGNTPILSVSYKEFENYVHAIICYKCKNSNYEPKVNW